MQNTEKTDKLPKIDGQIEYRRLFAHIENISQALSLSVQQNPHSRRLNQRQPNHRKKSAT